MDEFTNTRVRLQRLSDAKFCSGWVHKVTASHVVVRFTKADPSWLGSAFQVEVQGRSSIADFTAILELLQGNFGTLKLATSMKLRASVEVPRIEVRDLKAVVLHFGQEYDAEVVDISATGIGLRLDMALPAKDHVEIDVKGLAGTIRVEADIRYCRVDGERGGYRIGAQLAPLDRLGKGRWNRILEMEAA